MEEDNEDGGVGDKKRKHKSDKKDGHKHKKQRNSKSSSSSSSSSPLFVGWKLSSPDFQGNFLIFIIICF